MSLTLTSSWACDCGETGDGLPPQQFPECYDSLTPSDEETLRAALGMYEGLYERAARIAKAHGYGCEEITFDKDTFEVKWEERACSRGCCGYDTHYKTLSMHYLWTSDWETQIKAAQEAEALAQAEAEKQKKKETARKRLEAAEAAKATSFMDAETALIRAREELEALQEVSP